MDLRELRTFVAVVEEGRFSGAAQRLKLSQPAISHTIKGLEKRCGVALLERTSAGVRTTAAGKTLLSEARELLARYEQAMSVMSGGDTDETQLRVGIPFGLPAGMPSGALADLAEAFPSTVVVIRQLSSAHQADLLTARELDLGLLRHRPSKPDLDATLIADEPLGVIVSSTKAEQLGLGDDEIDLGVLTDLAWHGFPRDDSPPWYDEVSATLRGYGLDVESSSYSNQLTPDVAHAKVSLGRSFALAPACCRETLPPALTWRRLTGDPVRRRTWAAWPANSRRRDLGHLVSSLEDDHVDGDKLACAG